MLSGIKNLGRGNRIPRERGVVGCMLCVVGSLGAFWLVPLCCRYLQPLLVRLGYIRLEILQLGDDKGDPFDKGSHGPLGL